MTTYDGAPRYPVLPFQTHTRNPLPSPSARRRELDDELYPIKPPMRIIETDLSPRDMRAEQAIDVMAAARSPGTPQALALLPRRLEHANGLLRHDVW